MYRKNNLKKYKNRFFSWEQRTHQEKTNLVLAIGTIVAAVGTIISLFIVYYMTSKQNDFTKQSLNYTEESNKLTTRSLDVVEKNFLIEITPLVVISEIQLGEYESSSDAQGRITINNLPFIVTLKNFCRTIVTHVSVSKLKIFSTEVSDNTMFYDLIPDTTMGMTLGVNETKNIEIDCGRISDPKISGAFYFPGVYIVGRIFYRDVSSRLWFTQFAGWFTERRNPHFNPKGSLNITDQIHNLR